MKKQPNPWRIFFSLGFQIAIVMYAAVYIGQSLDKQTETTKPWWTMGLCIVGLAAMIRLIVNQTRKF